MDLTTAIEALYEEFRRPAPQGRLQNAFWRDCPGAEAEVIAFLRSDAVLQTLTR